MFIGKIKEVEFTRGTKMDSEILSLFYESLFGFETDVAFARGIVAISITLIVNVVLSVCLSGYTPIKRTWFLFLVLCVNLWFYAVTSISAKTQYFIVFIILSLVWCMPCFAFSSRKKKIRKDEPPYGLAVRLFFVYFF